MDASIFAALAVLGLLLSCWAQLRLLRLADGIERALGAFGLGAAHIVLWGYVLSALNHLDDVAAWAVISVLFAAVSWCLAFTLSSQTNAPSSAQPASAQNLASIRRWLRDAPLLDRWILIVPIVSVAAAAVLNLITLLSTAPGNWDSMTYHLARVAYFLQHGNTNIFGANYWAQEIHPANSALLLLFTSLMSARSENVLQLVQFLAYWAAVLGLYAISLKLGISRAGSVLASAVGALLVEWLMQATTTQNDMLLAAYSAAAACFLLAFQQTRHRKYLALTALNAALALGTKASFLLTLPSLMLVAAYALFHSRDPMQARFRDLLYMAGSALLAAFIFVLPAGYAADYLAFGNALGPQSVRQEVSFEGSSLEYVLQHGTLNLVRYGFDFLSLDGLPPVSSVRRAQTLMREPAVRLVDALHLDIRSDEGSRSSFDLQKVPAADEDYSYWGLLGPGLVWIAVLASVFGGLKSAPTRVFSLAALLFFLVQAYSGPYDPWRGRYFSSCAVFALPAVGEILRTKRLWIRLGLFLLVVLGSISALTAIVLRDNGALITLQAGSLNRTSIFTLDRIGQLTRNAEFLARPVRRFERLVPADATVAVAFPENSYEYPLFGAGLTRRLLPINSFDAGLQPIPGSADYLIYSQAVFPCFTSTDTYLGYDWYLRNLTDSNRSCP